MTQTSLARKLRLLRAERKLSLRQASKLTGLAKETLSDLERDRRHPNDVTLAKIAEAYGVSVEEFFDLEEATPEEPALAEKAEAPSPPEPSEEERRDNPALDAIEALARKRLKRLSQEVEDPNSPHFTNSTVATAWLTDIEKERRDWADWVIENAPMLVSSRVGEGVRGVNKQDIQDAFKVSGFLLGLEKIRRKAESRIKAMSDQPDTLNKRRLEKARREADKATSQLQAAM